MMERDEPMNQCEDTGDGAPPTKTAQYEDEEEEERRSKAQSIRQKTPNGPQPSCVSMKSDRSMGDPVNFNSGQGSSQQRIHQETPDGPQPTCVSIKSHRSMHHPLVFNSGQGSSKQRGEEQSSEVVRGSPTQLDSTFMLLEENLNTFIKQELKRFRRLVNADSPECIEDEEVLAGEEEEQRGSSREAFLKITLHFLRRMKQEDLAERLSTRFIKLCQHQLKSNLGKKYQCVFEGIGKAGSPSLLNQIYTELYITEEGTAGVNKEHEVRQIEEASRKPARPPTTPTTIRPQDIFKAPPGRHSAPIRTVLTTGVAGIGKTLLTHKFTLDWAEDKANQDVDFIFPFTFRELNLLRDNKFSLVGLVHHFFPQTKEAGICSFEDFQVVFILDGLDECRLPLDFQNNKPLTGVTESTSVDALLTNLIRGNLLPSARLWITTRPAAASHIPPECVSMVTEVRGFTDPQKEEYFRKRFRDEQQATAIISHIRRSRSLHIMCHIPVFCWISAVVLEDMLKNTEGAELPKSLTEMYIHFLLVQTQLKEVKYDGAAQTDPLWNPESRSMVESLGKLAFEQLQKGNLIFYESDLTECGLDIRAASVCSGVFTQIFREERALYQDKVYCFVHLSLQEFLAALHVHLSFINSGVNLLAEEKISLWSKVFKNKREQRSWINFYQRAVDKALESPHGHLDLFLRFLLGLSVQKNQTLLRGLGTQTGSSSETSQERAMFIKAKLNRKDVSPERSINLLHCLIELNDDSLVEEIQKQLRSGCLSTDELSLAQWSALGFILLSSEEDLDVFDLRKYSASEKVFLRLLPVVKASKTVVLSRCGLSERSCQALSSVLSSQFARLTQLDLSDNDLQDSGVKLLAPGFKSPHCQLEKLSLSGCLVTAEGCSSLASALSSNPSHPRDLDLSFNHLGDSGVQLLSAGLEDPQWKLHTLRLRSCGLSERSCEALSSVLSSPSSSLTQLDLSINNLKDSGMKLLAAGLKDPHCHLRTLRLSGCELSERGCEALSSVLSSHSSSLTQLDLSDNKLKDSGVKLLAAGLKSPHCQLEKLSLSGCLVTAEGCSSLASALSSNPSHLRELDLSFNHPGDSGIQLLSSGLEDPQWKLDTLRLDHGGEQRLTPGPRKYVCPFTVDTHTVNTLLQLSDNNRKVTRVEEKQPYPDHPDRFDPLPQLLCETGLTGRCYWEVEWRGRVSIAVSYREISRKGRFSDGVFGWNPQSWSLDCHGGGYRVWHNGRETRLVDFGDGSGRAAVLVDCGAGTVSFYSVSSSHTLTHLHTFSTTFTHTLYPGFMLWRSGSSVCV